MSRQVFIGRDRLFVYFRFEGGKNPEDSLERGVAALREAAHPVVTIELNDPLDFGQEFFRWEIATATAGSILGINPFDQPNVQESKDNTNRLLETVRKQGELPEENRRSSKAPLSLHVPKAAGTIVETLRGFLAQARPGDYVAIMAYLTEDSRHPASAASDPPPIASTVCDFLRRLVMARAFCILPGSFTRAGLTPALFRN